MNIFNANPFDVLSSTVRFFSVTINRFRNVNGNSRDDFDARLTVFFNDSGSLYGFIMPVSSSIVRRFYLQVNTSHSAYSTQPGAQGESRLEREFSTYQ